MEKKFKAIIFDLDGVICHTDKYHFMAWKSLADDLGIYFDETINNRLRGVSRMESLDIILEKSDKKFSDEEKLKIAEEKNEIYKVQLNKMSEKDLSDEVRTTLLELRKRGYLLAIGSSSKNTPLILKKIGLDGFFDAISDGNNISNSKPHPEVFLLAAQYVNALNNECLVVEDAHAGIVAAKAAGMTAAAIGDAVTSELADVKLTTFKDLLNI